MVIEVHADGFALWNGLKVPCVLGRGGIRRDKREGDGATPVGEFPLRRVLWRADRLERPETILPCQPIAPDDGWCDESADPAYNRPVRHPYPASAEHLWRDDPLYDVIAVIGHNDAPVVPGMGSAVFLHIARADGEPTAGCVAFARADLLRLLHDCEPDTRLRVIDPDQG